jgi:hypothetical protein
MKIRTITLPCLALTFAFLAPQPAPAQSIGGGTIAGIVKDPSGAAVPGATLRLHNAVTSYEQSVVTDDAGAYRFTNVPLNTYQFTISAKGFSAAAQPVNVSNTVPLTTDVTLSMADPSCRPSSPAPA